MKNQRMIPTRTVLSVDGFYSMYHFDLTNRETRGELHDFYELVYVESGFYYVILDGEWHTVPPGSVIFFAPNSFHSGDGTTRPTATVRIFSFECTAEAMHFFDNRVFTLESAEQSLLLSAFREAETCFGRMPHGRIIRSAGASDADMQRLKTLLELFLLSLYKEETPPTRKSTRSLRQKEEFRRVSDYMKANLKRPLTLSVIASECSIGETTLKRLCRIFCGCGPIDYLISLRVIEAKRLIRESPMNLGEIAAETGFSSLHYFSRTFKARTGMSPSEYAKAP